MKNLNLLALAIILLSLANCKSKQKTNDTVVATTPANAATAGKSEGEIQMEIVEARWPGTVVSELKEGQTIYTTKCTSCHKAYKIERFSEKKWLHEIDDMSPKAKLTAEEKLKLSKYILSYRETKEKVKVN